MGIVKRKIIEERISKENNALLAEMMKTVDSRFAAVLQREEKKFSDMKKDIDSLRTQRKETDSGPRGMTSVVPHPGNQISIHRAMGKLFQKVTPSGTIDGVNTVFTLTRAPFAGFIILAVNGKGMIINTDFTLSGNKITYTISGPPNGTLQVGDTHEAIFF